MHARERVIFMASLGMGQEHWGNFYKSLDATDKRFLRDKHGIIYKPEKPLLTMNAKVGIRAKVRVMRNGKDVTEEVTRAVPS